MGPCGRRPVAKPTDRSLRPHPRNDDEQLTGTAPVERVLLESVPVYPSDSPFTPISRVCGCAGRLFDAPANAPMFFDSSLVATAYNVYVHWSNYDILEVNKKESYQ